MNSDFLWVEKYRPRTIEDTILPTNLKTTFQTFIDQGNVPNLLLTGTAGVGKTTVARAMLEQLGCDYIVINGSLNGNIDVLRNDIQQFASSVSLSGGRKYVILDEADYLNANSTQPALRNFMEEFSRNCGFILTCNFRNRIIEPLHSRCSVIDFKITKADTVKLAGQFLKRVEGILEIENIKFERPVLAEIISKYFPDWRRVLNELQRYSVTGSIDTGILVNLQSESLEELLGFMKNKNYTSVRQWIGKNLDSDTNSIFRGLYDSAVNNIVPRSIPQLVVILAKYQYQAAFAADHEVNLAACLAEIMIEVEFK